MKLFCTLTSHEMRLLPRMCHITAMVEKAVKVFPEIVIAEEPGWRNCIEGSTAIVNLAGTPISTRWSSEIKKDIKKSRIRVTSKVVELINNSKDDACPNVLTSATAVGYYGMGDQIHVCREWEVAALKVNEDVRLALIRIGVVLEKDSGALGRLVGL
ncbi:hypothetical protein HAX54_048665 [Datura stramonium]|uniref:Uncharacterized protein n=1 Tax=Datura stramonium TaxID=4076 RepID=A0ABS8SU03_DATST|nr:hypothetical protein [Datura stramonium]